MSEITEKKAHTEISESYLNYRDDRVDYKIYIGRKIRRRLIVLDDKPGVVTKSLEIDLSNGYVYYDIDPAVAGAVSYYYDTANRTVDNYEIRRLLFEIRNTEFAPSPEVKAVLEQLPCRNWEEVLSQLPGWKEQIAHRYDDLYLPYGEVQTLTPAKEDLADPEDTCILDDGRTFAWKDLLSVCIASGRSKVSRQGWKHDFRIVQEYGKKALLYGNDNIGAEFFHEDEEFKRLFSDKEYRWFLAQVRSLISGLKLTGQEPLKKENKAYVSLRFENSEKAVFLADSPEKLLETNEKFMKFLKLELEIA